MLKRKASDSLYCVRQQDGMAFSFVRPAKGDTFYSTPSFIPVDTDELSSANSKKLVVKLIRVSVLELFG